jgi:hypothetical protein
MVVGQYGGRAVAGESLQDNFPRIDAGLRQSVAEELRPRDQAVQRIQEQDREDLIAKARQSGLQERRRSSRAVDASTLLTLFGSRRCREVNRSCLA